MTPAIATMAEMFEKAQRELATERDALRATNRQLAEANAALTARLAEFDAVCESLHQTRAEAAGLETDLKEARALNTHLAAQVDDARRQRDECAAQIADVRDRLDEFNDAERTPAECVTAMWQRISEYQVITRKMMAEMTTLWPETHDQARAVLHALATPLEAAVTTHTEAIAVTAERVADLDLIILRSGTEEMGASTDEAVALITALLADGRVHSAWLHGRGGK